MTALEIYNWISESRDFCEDHPDILGMCRSLLIVGRELDILPSDSRFELHEYIPKFTREYLTSIFETTLHEKYVYWWPKNDLEVRLAAFDHLLDLYDSKITIDEIENS